MKIKCKTCGDLLDINTEHDAFSKGVEHAWAKHGQAPFDWTAVLDEDTCPRCGGEPGPRPSKCPGCWDTCRAKFHEPNPCGKPADAVDLLFDQVRVCQRHYDLHMADALRQGLGSIARLGK